MLPPLPPQLDAILCVDDDPNILQAFERQFRKRFVLHTALGPEQGLEAVSRHGPFAVVVSDLRMPGMNGIQFLAAVRSAAPNTVRVMLTGQADLADAVSAVNQGGIFRLLIKPNSATVLGKVIEAGIEQYHLVLAEQQLTRQTLLGCVEVLIEVLSIVEPRAFSRATRVRRYARQLADALGIDNTWRFEAAAMLSQIGWITLPAAVCDKLASHLALSPEESQTFARHPASAARILGKIPRMDTVSRIIALQQAPYEGPPRRLDPDLEEEAVLLGAALLRIAIDFDELRQLGNSPEQALQTLRTRPHLYKSDVLAAVTAIVQIEIAAETRHVTFERLVEGMILEEDIDSRAGMCLVGRGQQLTDTMLERLRNGFYHAMPSGRRFLVRVPKPPEPEPPPA